MSENLLSSEPPPSSRVAMAYAAQPSTSGKGQGVETHAATQRQWEDLRREARKIEGELDVKIAAYGKLVSSFEYGYTKGESGLATDQMLQTKGSEIERLVARLSDEYRRLSSIMGAARDRADLLGGAGGGAGANPLAVQGSSGLLLRERGLLASAHSAMDEVMGTATAVNTGLGQQRSVLEGIGGKLMSVGAKFPVVNSLMNAIRRRKNRDNLIIAGVVAACLLFTLIYWANK
eukprot:scaffold11.g3875.t1